MQRVLRHSREVHVSETYSHRLQVSVNPSCCAVGSRRLGLLASWPLHNARPNAVRAGARSPVRYGAWAAARCCACAAAFRSARTQGRERLPERCLELRARCADGSALFRRSTRVWLSLPSAGSRCSARRCVARLNTALSGRALGAATLRRFARRATPPALLLAPCRRFFKR